MRKQYSTLQHTPFWAASYAVGDLVVRCPTYRAARHLAHRRTAERSASGVYLYSFTHAPISMELTDGGPCAVGAQGAFHGAEVRATPGRVRLHAPVRRPWPAPPCPTVRAHPCPLVRSQVPFVFDVGGFLRSPFERQLARAMWRLWVNFAWSGDPNVPPPFAADDETDADAEAAGVGTLAIGGRVTLAAVAVEAVTETSAESATAAAADADQADRSAVPLGFQWPRFDLAAEQNAVLGTPPDGNLGVEAHLHTAACQLWEDYLEAGEPVRAPLPTRPRRPPASLGLPADDGHAARAHLDVLPPQRLRPVFRRPLPEPVEDE